MERHGVKDSLGAANAAKLAYQSGRAARGLGTATKLTAAFDLSLGTASVEAAGSLGQSLFGASNTAKAVNSFARLSQGAKVVNFASKAAPVLAKGSGVIGMALGGFEVGDGIYKMTHGKKAEGTDKVVSGGLDIVTSAALTVAAGSASTGVGAPVAAIALGVAAGATAIKYGYKYRHEIGDLANRAGAVLSNGFHSLENIFK